MPNEIEPIFPSEFVWGAASASYQVEGAAREDGRGESIWDRFAATPGKVRNGENGDIACDHYHRYPEDVALMEGLGLSAYRFSIAWPRVFPQGRGRVNSRGLDFYDRLVESLLERSIQPYVTLYHWDLPQTLEDQGGWLNRQTAHAFEQYTAAVVDRLGDRVQHWITHNEPWCTSWLGYGWGVHAPGRHEEAGALTAAHNVLLSHGLATRIIRGAAPKARVGIALNLYSVHPASEADDDVAAARFEDGHRNRWFLDPIFRGTYPDDMIRHFGPLVPEAGAPDLEIISSPIDFLGVNYYTRNVVGMGEDGATVHQRADGGEYTAMGWEVYPDGLRDVLGRVQRDYGPRAMYITENGAAYVDVQTHDGRISDPERCAYMAAHLEAAGQAIGLGVNLRGYFVWSLLDNYEWARGYSDRFGIVYVDYPTLRRTPKGSYFWYRDFIARHARRQSAA